MNALVEDQLTRLRRALDSSSARSVFHNKMNDNKIYIGRYNSGTPVAGQEYEKPDKKGNRHINSRKINSLASALREADEAEIAAQKYANDPENQDPDKN